MSNKHAIDFYQLLPELYRLRDAELAQRLTQTTQQAKGPLEAFLDALSTQAGILKRNIDGLYDDLFIHTCDEWVIPYIGDLVANNPLHESVRSRRADVAKTIYYRRRKGILPVLEEIARDVTSWGAHTVAFFELLGWTQNLNHLRSARAPARDPRDPEVFDRVGSVNLRNLDALDRLDRPFDVVSHTVDVHPGGQNQGWYNIKKIGFFLWRLQSYPMSGVTARKSAQESFGYYFSPLGNPLPLFNNQQREADPSGLATELHVPGRIRPVAFHYDLEDYQKGYGNLPVNTRPSKSMYYGSSQKPDDEVSLNILKDGVAIPPIDVACANLSTWKRPPQGKRVAVDVARGRISFAQSEEPIASVTVVYHYGFSADLGGGPYPRPISFPRAALSRLPLQVPSTEIASIGAALGAWKATDARANIEIRDNRTYDQNLTVDLSGRARQVQALLSGELEPFPALPTGPQIINVKIGAEGPHAATLDPPATTLAQARNRLQEAIRAVPEGATMPEALKQAFTKADVGVTGNRLVVIAGDGTEVKISLAGGNQTASKLKLVSASSQTVTALLSGRLSPFPSFRSTQPAMHLTLGADGPYRVALGKAPESLSEASTQLQSAIQGLRDTAVFKEARVATLNRRLLVIPGEAGAGPLFELAPKDETTLMDLALESERAELILRSDNRFRPTVLGDITVTGGVGGARVRLEGLLIAGQLRIEGELSRLELEHCTLVPGSGLTEEGKARDPNLASILVPPGSNSRLQVLVNYCITGPLRIPSTARSLQIADSIVDSPVRGAPAQVTPVLISGSLPPSFTAAQQNSLANTPLKVTIGGEGPYDVSVTGDLSTLANVRDRLQEAVRAVSPSPAFTRARVLTIPGGPNRLIILPGVPAYIHFETGEGDPWRLGDTEARSTRALLSGKLPDPLVFRSSAPQITVASGSEGPHEIALDPLPTNIPQLRQKLRDEIRSLSASPVFADALVASDENRLLILPGDGLEPPFLGPASNDAETVEDLALGRRPAAIAGSADGAELAPPTTLERTTVFGSVHVEELRLASEVIFTDRVVARRRQAGCVRFSYAPDLVSKTPRRYRCQPDLALQAAGRDPQRTRARLVPSFTSRQYGEPAYGQLSLECAEEIRTGAEDGSEMGAFSHLKQPQREANLRLRLEEYLPFGLEPVLIFVT